MRDLLSEFTLAVSAFLQRSPWALLRPLSEERWSAHTHSCILQVSKNSFIHSLIHACIHSFPQLVLCTLSVSGTVLGSGDRAVRKTFIPHSFLHPRMWSETRNQVRTPSLPISPGHFSISDRAQDSGHVTWTQVGMVRPSDHLCTPSTISLKKRIQGQVGEPHALGVAAWPLVMRGLVQIINKGSFLKTHHCHLLENCHTEYAMLPQHNVNDAP